MTQIITDAELVAQYAKKAMEEPEKVIKTQAPSNSEVTLPGGYILPSGELAKTAEVKELNGEDEEAISKASSASKSISILLQRGLVKLGDKDASKEDLDALLSGDRDAILIGIRIATFGNLIPLNVMCGSCNHEQLTEVDLNEDVPVVTLKNSIADRVWEKKTKQGTLKLSLPNGVTQKKLLENIDKTISEINTILLSGCILSVDNAPALGTQTALSLGLAERNQIVEEILTKNPGPRLGEVKKVCKACGEDIPLPLGLLDLFRL